MALVKVKIIEALRIIRESKRKALLIKRRRRDRQRHATYQVLYREAIRHGDICRPPL